MALSDLGVKGYMCVCSAGIGSVSMRTHSIYNNMAETCKTQNLYLSLENIAWKTASLVHWDVRQQGFGLELEASSHHAQFSNNKCLNLRWISVNRKEEETSNSTVHVKRKSVKGLKKIARSTQLNKCKKTRPEMVHRCERMKEKFCIVFRSC